MINDKLIEIAQKYVGMTPQEFGLTTYGELQDKLEEELRAEQIKANSARDSSQSLSAVKDYLRDNYEEGCDCPACGQLVKLYRRRIGAPQCRGLILLYSMLRNDGKEWVHIREIVKEVNVHGDFAKMLHWGLIEEKPNEDKEKKNSGLWRITEKGKQFVRNEIKIPSHVLIYNGQFRGFSDTFTDIVESLGKKFNYNELMRA